MLRVRFGMQLRTFFATGQEKSAEERIFQFNLNCMLGKESGPRQFADMDLSAWIAKEQSQDLRAFCGEQRVQQCGASSRGPHLL